MALLFKLGKVVSTPGALDTLERSGRYARDLLIRHAQGDWGNVGEEDAAENDLSVREGYRILSSYGEGDDRIWIITEGDRSVTTFLRPDEY